MLPIYLSDIWYTCCKPDCFSFFCCLQQFCSFNILTSFIYCTFVNDSMRPFEPLAHFLDFNEQFLQGQSTSPFFSHSLRPTQTELQYSAVVNLFVTRRGRELLRKRMGVVWFKCLTFFAAPSLVPNPCAVTLGVFDIIDASTSIGTSLRPFCACSSAVVLRLSWTS